MSKTLLTTSKATHIEMSNCLAHEHFIHLTCYIYHKWHYKQITIYLTKKLIKKKKKPKSDICQLDQLVILDKLIFTCPIWLSFFG
jgi:uncharacterized protein YjhX (UPF0386 family)